MIDASAYRRISDRQDKIRKNSGRIVSLLRVDGVVGMSYLDFERLERLDAGGFRQQKPFPWVNPGGLLTESGYRELVETLPDVEMFESEFGVERRFGQQSHDRYNLEYREGLAVSSAWQAFIDELRSGRYRSFLERMFATRRFKLRFHWHYAPQGASVSPHCDSKRKLGSHLFYMNSSDDWRDEWGGQTVVLDDGGRLNHRSSPGFSEFGPPVVATCLDNMSFIFRRTPHSWHGIREITCPEGAMRKVFIVVIDDHRLSHRFLSGIRGREVEAY
jgi:hypothetical protein